MCSCSCSLVSDLHKHGKQCTIKTKTQRFKSLATTLVCEQTVSSQFLPCRLVLVLVLVANLKILLYFVMSSSSVHSLIHKADDTSGLWDVSLPSPHCSRFWPVQIIENATLLFCFRGSNKRNGKTKQWGVSLHRRQVIILLQTCWIWYICQIIKKKTIITILQITAQFAMFISLPKSEYFSKNIIQNNCEAVRHIINLLISSLLCLRCFFPFYLVPKS